MDRKEQQIAALPLFSGCNRSQIGWVASRADAIDVAPGTVLAVEGRAVREFVVVLDGTIATEAGTQEAGTFFGHLGLVDQMPHEHTVTALTPTRVLVFDARSFQALVERCPTVARQLMRELVTEIRTADRDLADAGAPVRRLRAAW